MKFALAVFVIKTDCFILSSRMNICKQYYIYRLFALTEYSLISYPVYHRELTRKKRTMTSIKKTKKKACLLTDRPGERITGSLRNPFFRIIDMPASHKG